MATGKVVRFNPDAGWGFIKSDEGGPDVFLYAGALVAGQGADLLAKDVIVSFETVDEGKGPRAVSVRVLREDKPGPGRRDFRRELAALADRFAREFTDEVTELAREHGMVGPRITHHERESLRGTHVAERGS